MSRFNGKIEKHMADLIQGEVGFFNGWKVSEETEREACEKAAQKISRYLMTKMKKAVDKVENE